MTNDTKQGQNQSNGSSATNGKKKQKPKAEKVKVLVGDPNDFVTVHEAIGPDEDLKVQAMEIPEMGCILLFTKKVKNIDPVTVVTSTMFAQNVRIVRDGQKRPKLWGINVSYMNVNS